MADLEKKSMRVGIPPHMAPGLGMRAMFRVVTRAALALEGPDNLGDISHAHPVFLDQEEAFALTQTYSDNSALIRVSTSILTACELVAAVMDLSRKSSRGKWMPASTDTRSQRESRGPAGACVAALRFYLIHQRTFGIAGKVMPPQRPRLLDAGSMRPAMFVMAHELSHHLLGHNAANGFDHDQEIDADVLGSRILSGILGPDPKQDRAVLEVVWQALAALEMHTRALFVRPPLSHPSMPERWDAVLRAFPTVPSNFLPAGAGVSLAAIREAENIAVPVAETDWTSLLASREWDTSYHDSGYFTLVRGLDLLSSYSREHTLYVLDQLSSDVKLRSGLHALWDHGLDAALNCWSLDDQPELTDPVRPLGQYELTEIVTGALLTGVTEVVTQRTIAAILATALSGPLRSGR